MSLFLKQCCLHLSIFATFKNEDGRVQMSEAHYKKVYLHNVASKVRLICLSYFPESFV